MIYPREKLFGPLYRSHSYQQRLNLILGIVKTRIEYKTGITYSSFIVMGPGMLILVLVLKDSLRTFFKSLSWSLGVRSLSLSWSLGVRSLLTSLIILYIGCPCNGTR